MTASVQFDFQRTPVTLLIAGAAAVIELASTFDPARREYFLNDLQLAIWWQIWDGQWWRPMTTAILHGNLLHAAFNLGWLLVFGEAIERWLGPARTLALYALLAYVSMLPEYVFDDQGHTAVGLSGVIYGLLGLTWIGRGSRPDLAEVCTPGVMHLMLAWLLFCAVASRFGWLPVANVAHVSGLIFGLLYGLAIFGPGPRRLWQGLAVAATLAVLATMVAAPWNAQYQHAQRVKQFRRLEREGVRFVPWPAPEWTTERDDRDPPDEERPARRAAD
jgi:membrane associated rhomboid family serine protease